MPDETKKGEVVEIASRQEEQAAQRLEKVVKDFMGGLPYDQARVIERGQDGFEEGARGFFKGGMALLLLQQNEGAQTFAQLLAENFPMICRRTAENYIRIARTMAEHPAFKAFVYDRGGHSKLLTLLQMCSEEQIADIAENDELLDKIDQMSVRQLKQALRRAKEKAEAAVQKATEKTAAENAALKEKVDELAAALAAPDLEAAKKLIRAAGTKISDALELLRKVDWELVSQDWTLRLAVLEKTNHLGNMVRTIEAKILALPMPEPPAKEGDGE